MKGYIARNDAALGINDGSTKEIAILSRVNKYVCFKTEKILRNENGYYAVLNRVSAQKEALEYMLDTYSPGDIIDAKITHLETFGAFADIGCGIVGLINIENISVSRISHPSDRFHTGQKIKTVIKAIDKSAKRFTLSHKELLGTWEENAAAFTPGQTVCGKVRSVEDYGIFIELTPNLAGLAEYKEDVYEGQHATVFVKNIIPEKMKIKLNIIDTFTEDEEETYTPLYYIDSAHINSFQYSPSSCAKNISTDFGY